MSYQIKWGSACIAAIIVATTRTAPAATLVPIASFTGSNGQYPYSTLVADSTGNLYGTTFFGGTSSDGNVFEVTGSGFVVATPEPATLALLTIASPLFLRRRHRTA